MDPSNPIGWYDKARAELKLGLVDRAINDLKRSISLGGKELKEMVLTDSAFDSIRTNKVFSELK